MNYVVEIGSGRGTDLLRLLGRRQNGLLKVVEIQTHVSSFIAKLYIQSPPTSFSPLPRIIRTIEQCGGHVLAPICSGVAFKGPIQGSVLELIHESGLTILEIKIAVGELFLYLASADESTFIRFLEKARERGFSVGLAGIYDEFLEQTKTSVLKRYSARAVFQEIQRILAQGTGALQYV